MRKTNILSQCVNALVWMGFIRLCCIGARDEKSGNRSGEVCFGRWALLLLPSPLVGWHHQGLLGLGSRRCYGIISQVTPRPSAQAHLSISMSRK